MDDCLFCKLANGKIPVEFIYEDEELVCFADQSPQTEVHVLIVPKKHYVDLLDASGHDEGRAFFEAFPGALVEIASRLGVDERGFRLITNNGKGAGQSVFHLHFHLMSDREKLREGLV